MSLVLPNVLKYNSNTFFKSFFQIFKVNWCDLWSIHSKIPPVGWLVSIMDKTEELQEKYQRLGAEYQKV